MAPNPAPSKHELIYDMIHSGELSVSQMAQAAGCSKHPENLFQYTAKLYAITCSKSPTYILTRWGFFPWDEFDVQATKSSISRALASKGWSKKTARVKARERNKDLRDEYFHFISDFHSYHLVYVDESGCDKRIGFRRTGWSPLGTTPVQVSKFHRDQRYQILPAYAQDGIVFSGAFQGSTDASCVDVVGAREESAQGHFRHAGLTVEV
ncbi:hypothetical protein NUU61_001379 [Penicillium alfredii]|uniref:Tc1-like transposase DDE domain-containing protein n=1 Tax=Penicillium alfredii TaxID=1506179 RepID=A0A9W9KM12_9EURO|nr:uncharacterized protein NUU61_001379 [Penicillium alfredii]KAJ5111749.1 hypothetical protein NUU61_001379 [Penicillium alfredii]